MERHGFLAAVDKMEFRDFSLLIGLTDKPFVLPGARITVGVGNIVDLTVVGDDVLWKLVLWPKSRDF